MTSAAYARLVCQALWDLARYDAIQSTRGFGAIQRWVARQPTEDRASDAGMEGGVCDAVELATCLYWKPVRCLQRSVCAMRLLRQRGIPARLIIGYREKPFFSHAWVEVGSRVVNDSPVYRKRLRILHSI